MNFLNGLIQNEPPPDDDATEKLEPPVFPLAGMSAMCTLIGPDGHKHWVKKGSIVFKLMKESGYKVGGAS